MQYCLTYFFYRDILYSLVVIPTFFLKNLQKKEALGKFSSFDICSVVIFVVCNNSFASNIV